MLPWSQWLALCGICDISFSTESSELGYVLVPGFAVCRGKQYAGGASLDVFTSPGHHRSPALDLVGVVVGAAHFILVDMRQCELNELRVPTMPIQDGTGH